MTRKHKFITPALTFGLLAMFLVIGMLIAGEQALFSVFLFGVSTGLVGLLCYQFFTGPLTTRTSFKANEPSSYKLIQLQGVVDTLEEGVVMYNSEGKVLFANQKLKDLFSDLGHIFENGVDHMVIRNKILTWLGTDSDETEKIINYLQQVHNPKEPTTLRDITINLPNGRHLSFRELYKEETGTISLYKEITDDIQQRRELNETHTMLSTVYQAIPIGICIYDANNKIISWNEKYLEVMEIEPDRIFQGLSIIDHLSEDHHKYENVGDDPLAFANSVVERRYSITPSTVERRFKSGKIVEISRALLPDGGFVCTFTDVTLEKSTQQLLKESENRYRKMVELSPDAILVHKDSIIIYANKAAISLLESKDLHSIVGDKVHKYFPVADQEVLHAHFGSADHLQPGQIVPTERSQVIGRVGNRIDVELEASALLYGDKPVMQIIARDISAQTKAQKLLKVAKEEAESAAQLKGTFLANMSHELRTPLNAVIGFSEIIKNEFYGKVGSPKYIEYAADIHASGVHLLELINEILDLSKIESGAQELFEERLDISKIVEECMRLTEPQRKKEEITVTSHLSSILPSVVADNKMIKQVILNLLSNAIKFTPSGGKVGISCLVERDGGLALSVEDNGIGIREDDIVKALTPFVQVDSEFNRRYQGTGLGLPLSKNLMELHGGRLEITSIFGSGTTVTIYLPSTRVELSAA